MTDHEFVREMIEKNKEDIIKLRERLRMQILMQDKVRTGIISLMKKVGGTIYPCEYNDALADVIRLIDKLEWEKNDNL